MYTLLYSEENKLELLHLYNKLRSIQLDLTENLDFILKLDNIKLKKDKALIKKHAKSLRKLNISTNKNFLLEIKQTCFLYFETINNFKENYTERRFYKLEESSKKNIDDIIFTMDSFIFRKQSDIYFKKN